MSNWYLIKLAGPKQKIQKYKIEDPAIKSFIFKYENLIPWDQIDSEQSIQQFIEQELIPSLYQKINQQSENNNYLNPKDINPQAPIQQIEKLNQEKKEVFDKWWKYLTYSAS